MTEVNDSNLYGRKQRCGLLLSHGGIRGIEGANGVFRRTGGSDPRLKMPNKGKKYKVSRLDVKILLNNKTVRIHR